MSYTDQFTAVDERVGPQPWMQLRQVASATEQSVSKIYDAADGQAKNELVQTVQASWTNNTPTDQWVYGMVTKGGSQVTLQTRSRGYLKMSHAVALNGGALTMQDVSRFGVGADVGKGGILALGAAFSINELRENSTTIPLMPQHTGWYLVKPGERIDGRVEVWFKSEFWENTAIDGGDNATESKFIAGEIRVDLFALPALTEPPPRKKPSIVGGPSNIQHDEEVNLGVADSQTSVRIPVGVQAGDILVAIVANNLGLPSAVKPIQSGWTLAHSRNDGLLGVGDVHMKIYLRTATDTEPATYEFGNGLLAEEIAVIMAIRDSVQYDTSESSGWHLASNLCRWKLVEEQVAPSIARDGQMLLCVSYFNHAITQAPITQTPPEHMTELIDINGVASTLAIAMLEDPPNPTFDRRFTPSQTPFFTGHSITASILVPGAQQFA